LDGFENARFAYVRGIAIDWEGNIFLSDRTARTIYQYKIDGSIVVYGPIGYSAEDVHLDAYGNLFFADWPHIKLIEGVSKIRPIRREYNYLPLVTVPHFIYTVSSIDFILHKEILSTRCKTLMF